MDILDEIVTLVNESRARMSGAADKLRDTDRHSVTIGQKPRDDRRFPETVGLNGVCYDEFDDVSQSGPLAKIAAMIDRHTMAAKEIGHKLDAHADRVYGPVLRDDDDIHGAPEPSRHPPALDRIFIALGDLDRAMSAMAQAAGRNCTLA